MKNVLLLENRFKKKYRNLALMKFSTYYKSKGYYVDYFEGIDTKNILKPHYDIICYSTIFTFYFDEDIKTIKYYKDKYPDAEFKVGGISATLLCDEYYKNTGILPHKGIDETIDFLSPDYSLFPNHPMNNISEVFTSRGCRNKCGFCAVKILEPNYLINTNWKDSIVTKEAMIHDNNLTTGNLEHFKDVGKFLVDNKIKTTFDNGLDCRFLNDNHISIIKNINFQRCGLRFAFDNMGQDGYIHNAINMCLKAGIPKGSIMVFILFNYNDTFDEAMYRAKEI